VFNSSLFAKHNEDKCDRLFYLGFFNNGKPRLGLIAGVKGETLNSPFSAPFGGFTFLKEDIKISYIDEALHLLESFAKSIGVKNIKCVIPPSCYHDSFIAKQLSSFIRAGFEVQYMDVNYQFPTSQFTSDYLDNIWYNAKKNFNRSIKSGLVFTKQETLEGKKQVYDVVARNRASRGFPLRMSWEQVKSTTDLIDADFFLVENVSKESIASAIVFHVAEGIVQVIYWGDLPEYAELKTMNYLSYWVFKYYQETGIKLVDIGPSSENGVPNFGLCEFKESIGCHISTKFTFVKSL
jgi:hypothetical protein